MKLLKIFDKKFENLFDDEFLIAPFRLAIASLGISVLGIIFNFISGNSVKVYYYFLFTAPVYLALAYMIKLLWSRYTNSKLYKYITRKPKDLIVESKLVLNIYTNTYWLLLLMLTAFVPIFIFGFNEKSNVPKYIFLLLVMFLFSIVLMYLFQVIPIFLFAISIRIFPDYIQYRIGKVGIKNKKYYFDKLDGYYFLGHNENKEIQIYQNGKRVIRIDNMRVDNFDEILANLPIHQLGNKEYSIANKLFFDIMGNPLKDD